MAIVDTSSDANKNIESARIKKIHSKFYIIILYVEIFALLACFSWMVYRIYSGVEKDTFDLQWIIPMIVIGSIVWITLILSAILDNMHTKFYQVVHRTHIKVFGFVCMIIFQFTTLILSFNGWTNTSIIMYIFIYLLYTFVLFFDYGHTSNVEKSWNALLLQLKKDIPQSADNYEQIYDVLNNITTIKIIGGKDSKNGIEIVIGQQKPKIPEHHDGTIDQNKAKSIIRKTQKKINITIKKNKKLTPKKNK